MIYKSPRGKSTLCICSAVRRQPTLTKHTWRMVIILLYGSGTRRFCFLYKFTCVRTFRFFFDPDFNFRSRSSSCFSSSSTRRCWNRRCRMRISPSRCWCWHSVASRRGRLFAWALSSGVESFWRLAVDSECLFRFF